MHDPRNAERRPHLWLIASAAALLTACASAPEPAPAPAPAPVAAAVPQAMPAPVIDPKAQFRQLSEALAGSAEISEVADGRVRINLASDLSFSLGKSDVKPDMAPVLDRIAQSLVQYPDSRAEIVGHTDTSGPAASNKALSLQRAESIRDQLTARQVAAERLSVRGMGEAEPVADNRTRQGRAANRRVEIFIARP